MESTPNNITTTTTTTTTNNDTKSTLTLSSKPQNLDYNDCINRFKRFLIIGNDRISACVYNVELKIESIKSLFDLIKENRGVEAVNLIKKYKDEKLLIKNDTLVYSLAICARSRDEKTKKAAYEIVNSICMSPFDFFKFVSICETINFEIAFKLNESKLNASKSSVDITRGKNILKSSKSEIKFDITKSQEKIEISPVVDDDKKERPLSKHSITGLKPLLALRLNSGKSHQEGNSDLIIETSTAELFSSRKTSAASTLRSELTFLTTERKDSALTSSQVTHLPLIQVARLGSAQSIKKPELPLISERTNSAKSRGTPVQQQNSVVRPGSAKPIVLFDLNGDQTPPSRRFNDSYTNSTNEIATPSNVQTSVANTKSPSLASLDQQKSSRPLSRTQSVKSINHPVPVRPLSRQNSMRIPTPTPRVGTPIPSQHPIPPIPTPRQKSVIEKKGINFANTIEIAATDLETTNNLNLTTTIHEKIIEETNKTSTTSTIVNLVDFQKKHVDETITKAVVITGSAGWGRSHRRAVSSWYITKDPKNLVYLITKHQKHAKWTHNDILKLAHPKSIDPSINMILKFIANGFDKVKEYYLTLKQNQNVSLINSSEKQTTTTTITEITEKNNENLSNTETISKIENSEITNKKMPEVVTKLPDNYNFETLDYIYEYLEAFTKIKKSTDETEIINLIEKYNFQLEHIQTKFFKSETVWLALIEHSLKIDVILRNLNKLSNMKKFLNTNEKYIDLVCEKLKNKEELRDLNVTSFTLLNIWKAYEKGSSQYGGKKKRWQVQPKINVTLQTAFHDSLNIGFNSKKKICILLNIWKHSRGSIYGNANLSCLEAGVFMCLSHLSNEDNCKIYNFTNKLNEIDFKKDDGFKINHDKLWNLSNLASTEYIKSIEEAANDSLDFDVFIIYTNLLLARNLDVNSIINNYRKKLNKPFTKLIIVSLVASLEPVCSFNDPLSLDLLGFGYETPNIIYNFISDKF